MNRRSFVRTAAAASVVLATTPAKCGAVALAGGDDSAAQRDLFARWQKMDKAMRGWWDGDLARADEAAVLRDAEEEPPTPQGEAHPWSHSPPKTLVYLPFPYISCGGSVGSFPEMYGWDTHFINLGLLAHGRTDIVRLNILDQLSMIERFGKVLNGNRTYYKTRGQPPLLAMSVEEYLAVKGDDEEVALLAYPLLERSYNGYWNNEGHATPIGLSTCRDSGDRNFADGELASECEAGLDFTPIFGGKIRECVPIHVNCALVRQAQVLAALATRFGWKEKAAHWRHEAETRADRINRYCWDATDGFYFEYNYVQGKRLPYFSLNAFWPLWTGIASEAQARRAMQHLPKFDHAYGLTFTDRVYPEVHPEYKALEWSYPEAWPQQQVVAAEAMQKCGEAKRARAISRKYIANVIATWEKTGLTWERYNAVDGGHDVPIERDAPQPLHGFTSASAVVVGRIAFD